jgi:small subunit ribosomal protein S8e
MALGRKITGGKYHAHRKKKLFEIRGQTRLVKLGKDKIKKLRTKGGNKKLVSLAGEYANVIKNGKAKKTKIINVIETHANRFLARQNIMVKGAIIETELGNARITNRPGQEGTIQAVFVEYKKAEK